VSRFRNSIKQQEALYREDPEESKILMYYRVLKTKTIKRKG
jgi:hypothetical protein